MVLLPTSVVPACQTAATAPTKVWAGSDGFPITGTSTGYPTGTLVEVRFPNKPTVLTAKTGPNGVWNVTVPGSVYSGISVGGVTTAITTKPGTLAASTTSTHTAIKIPNSPQRQ